MKILQKSKDKITFVEEINESLANAIRRSVLEIPILAIDEIEFFKNDSVLYDEVLALRLGLIPLKTEKDMELKEDCSCKGKGCGKCQVQLKLVSSGNNSKIVYSKELSGQAKPVYPDIPIAILEKDQEIELVAKARLGKGIEHTKFSPGLVYYRNVAEIQAKACSNEEAESIAKICPLKVLKSEKGKIEIIDKYKCDLCEACVEEARRLGKECINIVPGKEIIFSIESFGQIEAEDIMLYSIKALKSNLEQFK